MKKVKSKSKKFKLKIKKTSKHILTNETPEKVCGWLIVSLFSLTLLFAIASSDASFGGTSAQLPDPFAPQKVVKIVDNAAAGYSHFLSANFLKPLAADYSIYSENAVWIFKESGLAYTLGIERLINDEIPIGQVAGASVSKLTYSSGGLGINSIYSVLIH